jgi:hypothetical protein
MRLAVSGGHGQAADWASRHNMKRTGAMRVDVYSWPQPLRYGYYCVHPLPNRAMAERAALARPLLTTVGP